jgi:hypothetical protein
MYLKIVIGFKDAKHMHEKNHVLYIIMGLLSFLESRLKDIHNFIPFKNKSRERNAILN